jgi:hypothetical protein
MSTCCDETFWSDQLAAAKTAVAAYNAALLALSTGAQSYTLDTGQTKQTVTKADLGSLRLTRSALLNEVATLEARLCGGSVHVTPGF